MTDSLNESQVESFYSHQYPCLRYNFEQSKENFNFIFPRQRPLFISYLEPAMVTWTLIGMFTLFL